MTANPPKRLRCAVYTRKSTEEGLDQVFNSLDAQREACGAYVLSQASEGWNLLPDIYDDGGISGGTLERPALQRLLADIADGRIDTIATSAVASRRVSMGRAPGDFRLSRRLRLLRFCVVNRSL